jgi:hypothetical protein
MAQPQRLSRRLLGYLKARVPEVRLERVPDPRDPRGRRWPLRSLLVAVLAGVCTGWKSLAQVEALSDEMSPAGRRVLGLKGRVPDTTLRDLLVTIAPEDLRPALHRQVKVAHRRKALEPWGLPFGVAAFDGRGTAVPFADEQYAQRQSADGASEHGVIRTTTVCLVSSRAKTGLDVRPIDPATNEMGAFRAHLAEFQAV